MSAWSKLGPYSEKTLLKLPRSAHSYDAWLAIDIGNYIEHEIPHIYLRIGRFQCYFAAHWSRKGAE